MAATEERVSSGRRCAMGCETWPDDKLYKTCPVCDEPTSRFRDVHPLDPDEALSKKRHADFERWCEEAGR